MKREIKFIGHIICHNVYPNDIFEGRIMGRNQTEDQELIISIMLKRRWAAYPTNN